MKTSFPFWVGQVDPENLPTWCSIVLMITLVISIISLIVIAVKEWKE